MTLPVIVVAGSLGVGKTTLISQLLAGKPHAENWVVLLNEFTEAGIDALTVAAAARGRYDVRLVAGGCLCCTGEQDFRRNLSEIVASGAADRLIVEPSGAGHPGGMIEELLAYQTLGQLRLEAVLGLIDPLRVTSSAAAVSGLARDQLDSADIIVLSKPDLANDGTWRQLTQLNESFFPPRQVIAASQACALILSGMLQRLIRGTAEPGGTDAGADVASSHRIVPGHGPDHSDKGATAESAVVHLAGQAARSWRFERGCRFDPARVQDAMRLEASLAHAALRIKGVFQVSDERWLLIQYSESGCSVQESSWRRDSRVEVLGDTHSDWSRWDAVWCACVRGS